MKKVLLTFVLGLFLQTQAQEILTPEKLWQIKRVSPIGISADKQNLIYSVTLPNVKENNFSKKYYEIALNGGISKEISAEKVEEITKKTSPDKQWQAFHKAVKVEKVKASDFYPELEKSSGSLFSHLDYRHWDKFLYGDYNHIFVKKVGYNQAIDVLEAKPFHSPQEPFGGAEDYVFSPDSQKLLYVTKAKSGTAYVNSTNTDIFEYDLTTQTTKNLTEGLMGYDTHPAFSKNGVLAWLSMKTDGNEADKNDILILQNGKISNITQNFDISVESFKWAEDGQSIFLILATEGTKQLFQIFPFEKNLKIDQLTRGDFDINNIVGQSKNLLVLTRTTMNRASEVFSFHLKNKTLTPITTENDDFYKNIAQCTTQRRYVKTSDGKNMLVWVILPPNFDPNKKYPALLYCQGGPQSALTQFYSFRWNFQLMASQGYVVIAPSRRGMPGFGVEWNAQISKDWAGQPMRDYLSASDEISKEKYIDKDRMAAVGASYGGYSVFYLAGIHQNRFKSFISHCGVFDLRSMYGTTEEKFFNNQEHGGAYWENNQHTNRAYGEFNPINFVNQWNTPILIIQGGKDYRVPKEQAFQAFTAAQQKGIKSELLYFPDENHWVVKPQNGIFWQRNFYRWLKETLK